MFNTQVTVNTGECSEKEIASTSSEPKKKLNKKQARKLAKKKNAAAAAAAANGSKENEHDQLVQDMTQISLESTPADAQHEEEEEEESSDHVEENDKNEQMPTLTTRAAHPSVYRRHMSESHVDLEANSNSEFKLKVRPDVSAPQDASTFGRFFF